LIDKLIEWQFSGLRKYVFLLKTIRMKKCFTLLLSFITYNLFAQQEIGETKREIKYSLEAGAYLSTDGNTPFWLRANQYGIVPLESNFVTLRGDIHSDYKKASSKEANYKLSKFDWGYGLNIVGNLGKKSDFFIPEAYVKAKYGKFEIYAGRRKEIVGLVDSTLSSGSYIWSGNALPIPKVQISTPDFVPLEFTKGFLSFKGNYAHGWFENSRTDVENFYLHQKSLYFRLGKPDWKFHFYGGFNHQVQWGGKLLYPDPLNQSAIDGIIGTTFNDYLNAVTGRSLAVVGDTTKNGGNEALNRSGNHLGTLDVGFDIKASSFSVLCYRQSIFEDGSLAYLSNIYDGLSGISLEFKENHERNLSLKKIVFEYLNTVSQGGILGSQQTEARLRGQDNYFNNGVYRNGWVYNNQTIGTPFINQYKNSIIEDISNNRVETYHVGINMNAFETPLSIKFSYTNNYGTYNNPLLAKNQLNTFIQVSFNLRNNFNLLTSIANSSGLFERNSLGIGVILRKHIN
jgi:Capsule assembly protein Wzi